MKNQLLFSVVGAMCAVAPSLQASISLIDIFKNISYTQTSGSAPTTPTGFFADVELTSQNAGDYSSVTVTYPGPGSPVSLPVVSSNFFSYGPGFASLAAMNAAIPFGSYAFVTNTAASASLNYNADAFTSSIPALSAGAFNSLNGLNVNDALTVMFNSFSPNPGATEGFTFFSIFDAGGAVFSDGFLAPGSTSLNLPANTLLANTTYSYELDFSDRIDGTAGAGVSTLIGSDVRTDGTFTTGAASTAPEPGAWMLIGSGLLALGIYKKRFGLPGGRPEIA